MRNRFILAVCAGLWMSAASVQTCWADSPPYVILQAQPPRAPGIAAPAQAYSYGWFGAAPRKHFVRHSGYHRRYIQWSKK